ncbi:MAG: protein kinase domain-containing protein [Anaerolineae bacterium]
MLGPGISHLEILELLGLGASAEVYRALDRARGCEVAVKVLSERAEPAMVMRFLREVQTMARLDHPHIVETYSAGEESGRRYIVMELMRGQSLKERLLQGKLPWQEAVQIALQVARALEHAHARQIVHRDVKPGNIMFGDDVVKLADFGLAHLDDASAMTRTGTVMGTVFYLSPEQAVGRHVDGRSDLYALGAVLFEMLVGRPPFTGTTAVSIIYKHLNEQPPRLRQIDPSLPLALESIVDRLLQKDPTRRYDSASDLVGVLDGLLNGGVGSSDDLLDGWSGESQDLGSDPAIDAPLALVGRGPEMAKFEDLLDRTVSGSGRLALIAGEAGIGKTRLAREVQCLARSKNVLPLVGDCLYGDAPNPYAPFVEILRAYKAQVGQIELSREPGSLEDHLAAAIASADAVMGLTAGESAASAWQSQGSPQEGQLHAFERLCDLLQLASRQRPLLMVLDNLQWASPTTLQLLHYLARGLRGARVLIVGLYRPEDVLPDAAGAHPLRDTLRRMSREHLYDEITLSALSQEDIGRLASQVLRVADLESEFVGLLSRECEGSPLYLLEMLHLLREQGALEQVDDHWELAAALAELDIPPSVVDLVMRRVERVGREDRELLEWAAVVGQRVDVPLLATLLGESPIAVMRRLYALEQHFALLVSDDAGFIITHEKVREVLYEQIPATLRREYHRMVGESLEERVVGDPGALVFDLARHFAQSGESARGYRYSVLAADRAEKAFAPSEAVAHVAQALHLLEKAPEALAGPADRLTLQHRYARLLLVVGRQDDACAAFEHALSQSRSLKDVLSEANLLLDLGVAIGRVGDWERAISLCRQSLDLADSLGEDEIGARSLQSMGFFAFEQGAWDEAMKHLETGLAVARQRGYDLLQARILGNMGIVQNARGDRQAAIELFQHSVETFEQLGQPLDMARCLNNMGYAHYCQNDQAQAQNCYRRALELLGKVGDVREQGLAHLHLAESALAMDDLAKAREHCGLAARRFARLGHDLGVADVDRIYGGIARRERRWAVAERYLREAIAVYAEYGDPLNLAETHEELGKLLAEAGEEQGAAEELARSRIMFENLLNQT